jgi:hypothetical protein
MLVDLGGNDDLTPKPKPVTSGTILALVISLVMMIQAVLVVKENGKD